MSDQKKKKKPTPKSVSTPTKKSSASSKSATKRSGTSSSTATGGVRKRMTAAQGAKATGNKDDFKKPGASEGEQMMNVAMFLAGGSAMGEIARGVIGKLGQMGAKDEAAAVLKAIHKSVGAKPPVKMSRVDEWNTLSPGHPIMQAMEKALAGAGDRMGSMAQPAFHNFQNFGPTVSDEMLHTAGAIGGNARLNAIGAAAAAQDALKKNQ